MTQSSSSRVLLITGAPFGGDGDSPLYADVNAKLAALVAGGKIDVARAEELRAAAAAALIGSVQPAYEALIAWAEADRANSDEIATGVWKLPDGPAYYTDRLAASTTTAMTADEIHELGLAEVARIHAEMEAIKRQVGFDGTLQEFFASLRGNPQFLFPNTDEGREGYLQTSRDYYAGIEARLPEFFGLLPKAGLVVKRVEAFREQPGAAQHYQQGTLDGSRPGTYYVASDRHEFHAEGRARDHRLSRRHSRPSHADLDPAGALERADVPHAEPVHGLHRRLGPLRRAAREGDGRLSTTRTPTSAGSAARSGARSASSSIPACTRRAGPSSKPSSTSSPTARRPKAKCAPEIRRYIVTPGQATAYKVGMLKFLELRERAASGARRPTSTFARFHDTVLGGGALPLEILERRVDDWIAAERSR